MADAPGGDHRRVRPEPGHARGGARDPEGATQNPERGLFVTFEGPEGSGKTTQLTAVAARLEDAGQRVLVTREPGGTPAGERIRALLLDPEIGDLLPETETLLFCAARAELVTRAIRPALDAGTWVLCDRFFDATLAYQGAGRGLPMERLRGIIRFATGGLVPDLTLLLDMPVVDGLARRRRDEANWNRLDGASRAFHERVREGYHRLAAAEPERWRVVDASADVDAVTAAIWSALEATSPARRPRATGASTSSPAEAPA
jgi:dTMP kinase